MLSLPVFPDFLPESFLCIQKNIAQSQLCVHFCILFPYLKHFSRALKFFEYYKTLRSLPLCRHAGTYLIIPLMLDTIFHLSSTVDSLKYIDAEHQYQSQQIWEPISTASLTNQPCHQQQLHSHLLWDLCRKWGMYQDRLLDLLRGLNRNTCKLLCK